MDSLGLYDIYDYWYMPFWQTNFFKIAIACVMIALCSALVFLIVKKIKTKRSLDSWDSWHTVLDTLRKNQVANKKFYYVITQVLKEVAVSMLSAPDGSTDVELSFFFKNEQFPEKVRILADVIDQASTYKFDPVCTDIVMQEKELERIIEALAVVKKMVQAKQ